MRENQTRIIGHLGQRPLAIEGKGGIFLAFSVAVSSDYFDSRTKGWVSREPNWVDCIAFGDRVIQSLKTLEPGCRLQIEGALSVKKTIIEGKKIPITKVVVEHAETLSPLKQDSVPSQAFTEQEVPEWNTVSP